MPITQTQAVQAVAEMTVQFATDGGSRCGLVKGTEAAMVLEQAFAIAIADMIGPGADTRRIRLAIAMQHKNLTNSVIAQYHDRHGVPRQS